MTTAEREAINKPSSPATGLLIHYTDTNSLWYYKGTAWINTTIAIVDARTTAKGALKLAVGLTGLTETPTVGISKITTNIIVEATITNNGLNNATDCIYKRSESLTKPTTVAPVAYRLQFSSTATYDFRMNPPILPVDAINHAVGIEPTAPNTKATLDLPLRMTAARSNPIAPTPAAAGLTIYNTNNKCLKVFNGAPWYNIATRLKDIITSVNCDSTAITAPLTMKVTATGIILTIPYRGGNVGTYMQKVSSRPEEARAIQNGIENDALRVLLLRFTYPNNNSLDNYTYEGDT